MNAELSLAAVDTLWEDLRLGRFPFPLEVRSHGDSLDVRARIKAAVYADLGRRGLAQGSRPDDDLVEDLRLLADPAVCIDLVALLDMTGTDPVRAVAVARGRRGLLVVQGKLAVSFSRMRDTTIAGALVELLPDTRAALGSSITQPAAAVSANQPKHRRAQPGGVLRTAAPRDMADSKLRAIAAIMEKPVRRAGQVGVTLTDETGKRHRQPGIAWFDTDDGRYATTMTRGRDGEDWVTLWPADNTRLTHRLSETIARG
ncbi:MAG: ESX secretion-associated protein EspG [Actinophytocola sp.]|uniref:ESX secretion-associated protein EspG n=1 Tax=Actinophytocola sp. TaxID=1872138 RepID=UPI0013239C44|nr:ESX secretion-associated protein EspG [Actinophytocola sp.]MPZ82026.1 ESX secretion-associated protein EspG [Actinophytocola sp.]